MSVFRQHWSLFRPCRYRPPAVLLSPLPLLRLPPLHRLHPRHDDSTENVEARLALWDLHERALRAAYEDVSLRVPAGTPTSPATLAETSVAFLSLEAQITGVSHGRGVSGPVNSPLLQALAVLDLCMLIPS
jgi:hypothetical protein